MLPARQLCIIEAEKLHAILPHFNHKSAVGIGDIFPPSLPTLPAKQASNLLGQEFDYIFFDACQSLDLEAFAIAAGTLKAGGTLYFIVQDWATWTQQIDNDSLRWNGDNQPISTPHFRHWFQQQVHKFFPVLPHTTPNLFSPPSISIQTATAEQQSVLNAILAHQSDIYFLTAKRGRGKSALAGMLAKQLHRQGKTIYLTAPNKSAVKILQIFAQQPLTFLAPDTLSTAIQHQPQQFADSWLLVDEAAMIPLDLLQQFSTTFRHILFTTTIHSYEGTGRGFKLKFMQKMHRSFHSFELTKPLRWANQDPLEVFLEQTLLLNIEDQILQPDYMPEQSITYQAISAQQRQQLPCLAALYGLLSLAHYRTTPTDLRRLFDAPKQHLWRAQTQQHLIGCLWAVEEGGILDKTLIQQIIQGKRRPRGNLVAQLLAFQTLQPDFCRLKSLRISRIAVQPHWQQQGIGSNLITQFIQAYQPHLDFVSVSFGYNATLAHFWQQCGFTLVYLSEHKEASSGCYNAVMLKPLSAQGKQLCQTAQQQFDRNISLSFHPLAVQFATEIDWQLNENDQQSLKNFAHFHRTLPAALPAIRRLLKHYSPTERQNAFPLLNDYLSHKKANLDKKSWLAACRLEIKAILAH